MRTKNKTPFLFGAVPGSIRPPEPSATLVVKATFRLRPGEPLSLLEGLGAQGTLTGDVFAPEDDERRGALLYASDFADFKPKADVIVRARCHTPGNRPMVECPARVSVGAWSKALRVIGRRVWVDSVLGAVPSDPVPFTEMPIDYTQAFGGPAHAENPVGKGVDTPELHTVEAAGDVVRKRRDRIAPASFAPLSPFWPQRRAKVGKEYGRSWQAKRAPFPAEDFDPSYHNAAPSDQQIDTLRGDEEMSFLNLHPAVASFSAKLPGVRVRVFLLDDRGRAREVAMRLDTLFADLEAETLSLSWRGVDAVRDDDLGDLTAALVTREPFLGPPAPVERHLAELRAFAADPVGFRRRREEIFGHGEPPPPPEPEPAAPDQMARPTGDDPVSAAADERLRDLPRPARDRVRLALSRMGSMSVKGHDLERSLVDALKQPPDQAPPLAMPRKPGALPYVPLGHRLRPIRELAEKLRAHNDVAPRLGEADKAALAEAAAIENDPFVRQLDPYSFRPGGPGRDEPGPGADLSGRDFSGQDLSGKDLSGANLEGALLQHANLSKANLRGARMKHAILHEANLAEAHLEKADLTQANLTGAKARRAVLREANVDQAILEKADLAEADLSGAAGEYVVFSRADLRAASLRGVKLHKSHFENANLAKADLSGATLHACRLREAQAEQVNLTGARLDQSSFDRALLRGAVLTEARGERVSFRLATLAGADLRSVVFKDAFFDEAEAGGANLAAASLRGARFYRASLAGARAAGADLLGAELGKADLTGASFAGANLFGAGLRLALREGCDFSGANLGRVADDGRVPADRQSSESAERTSSER